MKEGNLKLAQEDIEAALKAVEDIENFINDESLEKDVLKQKFVALSEKVQQLENLLKIAPFLLISVTKCKFLKWFWHSFLNFTQ